jgi:lipopolysaccharide export system protein LptA
MRQNCVKLSKLILPLVLLVAACQATSLPNKSTIHANYGSNHQSKHNSQILDAISDYVVTDVGNTVIFKGNAELKREQLVRFLADCISVECPHENAPTYVVEMKGNVSMMTLKNLTIKSEKAGSLDFSIYIDFAGNVSISNKGEHYKADWVRYHFLQEELQVKSNDIPTRSRWIMINPPPCER